MKKAQEVSKNSHLHVLLHGSEPTHSVGGRAEANGSLGQKWANKPLQHPLCRC